MRAAGQTNPASLVPERESRVASAVSPVRTSVNMVPKMTNTELQEMLTNYEELGRPLRQGVMGSAEQSPRYS